MGLDIYLHWRGFTEEDRQAQISANPGEGGEVGYLRSSYNDGGLNSWARRHLGASGYYHVFGYDRQGGDWNEELPYLPVLGPDGQQVKDRYGDPEEGLFPDWDASRERCLALLEKARGLDHLFLVRPGGPILPSGCAFPDSDDALDAYRRAIAPGGASSFEAWSCWEGYFTPKRALPVKAVLWTQGRFGGPEPVLVCEDERNPHEWYVNALADCLRFIDLGQRKGGWLRWSS